jgi:hypothetical protein
MGEIPESSSKEIGTTEVSQAVEPISFAEFLEDTPPSQERVINDLFAEKYAPAAGRSYRQVQLPALVLHCSNERCNGSRTFRRISGDLPSLPNDLDAQKDLFLTFVCSNCRLSAKTYSVRVMVRSEEVTVGSAIKFGERPVFGPPTPTRLLKLLGDPTRDFPQGQTL